MAGGHSSSHANSTAMGKRSRAVDSRARVILPDELSNLIDGKISERYGMDVVFGIVVIGTLHFPPSSVIHIRENSYSETRRTLSLRLEPEPFPD